MAGAIWPHGTGMRKRVLAQEEGQAAFCRLGRGLSPLPFCYLNAPLSRGPATAPTGGLPMPAPAPTTVPAADPALLGGEGPIATITLTRPAAFNPIDLSIAK